MEEHVSQMQYLVHTVRDDPVRLRDELMDKKSGRRQSDQHHLATGAAGDARARPTSL